MVLWLPAGAESYEVNHLKWLPAGVESKNGCGLQSLMNQTI